MLQSDRYVKPRMRSTWSGFQTVAFILAAPILIGYAVVLIGRLVGGEWWIPILLPGAALALVLYETLSPALPGSLESELADHRLRLEGDCLVQESKGGEELARIDLTRPYEYLVLKEVPNLGIYRLFQDGEELTFGSFDPLAAEVVPKVIGLRWPPVDRRIQMGPLWRR